MIWILYLIAFAIAIYFYIEDKKKHSKSKSFLYALCMLSISFFLINILFSHYTNSSSSESTYMQLQPEEKEQIKTAAIDILNHMSQHTDEVEKVTWYESPGAQKYEPINNIYWSVEVNRNMNTQQFLTFVTYSDFTMESIFWNKLTFSTNEENWEYYIGSGVTGNGKDTQIIHGGGRYEFFAVQYDKVEKGIKLLVEGTNPIIRYSGMSYYQDYHVPPEVIQELKRAIALHDHLEKLNNSLK